MGKSLIQGWNLVVYTGRAQLVEDAFASILPYLQIAYLWDNINSAWLQAVEGSLMVPYGCYFIEVSQDCDWSYGPDETPPTSVSLYSKASADGLSHTINLVPYCGPEQLPDKALAAIWSYLIGGLYYDNVQKSYLDIDPNSNMVPNTPYGIWVSQDCIWDFVPAGPSVPDVTEFKIADYVKV